MDESSLTGETFPVEKSPGVVAAADPISSRSNALFAGTHVVSGRGAVLIAATGGDTELSRVAAHVNAATPQHRLREGHDPVRAPAHAAHGRVRHRDLLANLLLQRPLVDSALFSLALAVGLTPQLLPAIVSISLAQGARMMARERVIVRAPRRDRGLRIDDRSVLRQDGHDDRTAPFVLDVAIGLDGAPSEAVARAGQPECRPAVRLEEPDRPRDPRRPSSAVRRPSRLGELPYDFLRKRLSVLVRRAATRMLCSSPRARSTRCSRSAPPAAGQRTRLPLARPLPPTSTSASWH